MNTKSFIHITLIAVSYYLFSNEFFQFSAEIKEEKVSLKSRFLSFLLIYAWFIAASFMELPLVANWFIFLIILCLEVRLVFSFDWLVSCALSMFCVIMSLAANVFFRSGISILLQIPLTVFDNSMSYLKIYPIFFGFIAMAILLFILRRFQFSSQLKRMLQYRQSLIFYTYTEVFIYFFLIVQLLAYSQSGNDTGIKTWGIKSSLFSIFVLIITIVYSLRVASLYYYMNKQHDIHNQLIQEKEDINKLWTLAYTDMLTGCSNRLLLDKRLEEYAGYGGSITLAFIDVNGLKTINDEYGHMEGDNYLIAVSRILSEVSAGFNIDLFRYGGDEFVMMSNTCTENTFTDLLIRANERLQNGPGQYSRSISYGVIRGNCADYSKLLSNADDKMYQHKLKHYEHMIRS